MLCLGIETSCDETAAAVVRDGRVALSDVVSTQIDIHRRWGGVVPELASRNHVLQVMPVIDEALRRAGKRLLELDVIAVTSGPGLQGALLVGLQVAKSLSAGDRAAFVGVNHLEGHLLAIRLVADAPEPPFLGLVVSGGHTTLYEVPAFGTYRRLGTTRDDAAGEAYDKVARLLGLPYPGGLPIDELAQTGDPKAIAFPARSGDEVLDWSFSGLKTSVLQPRAAHGVPTGQALGRSLRVLPGGGGRRADEEAGAGAKKAGAQQLVLCGGVAANSRLRALAARSAPPRRG